MMGVIAGIAVLISLSLAAGPVRKATLPDDWPNGPMVADITRQSQLHELPRALPGPGPRKRHASDQAGDPELPPGAIRKP